MAEKMQSELDERNQGNTAVKSSKEIDGQTFSNMVISAANALDNDKKAINDLNVFPVPDGDTGINMSMTLEKPAKELSEFSGSISDVANKAADTSLRAARGNSGTILSLFFRGMAKSLHGKDKADSRAMAEALESGTKEAYKAVSSPKEGTILTVMRAASDEANAQSGDGKDVNHLFERVISASEETLEKTPEMLPVLKEAEVVDAGGKGFVVMLKGMYAALLGHPIGRESKSEEAKASAAAMANGSDEAIKYAYCTECIVDKDGEHQGEGSACDLREYAEGKGDSLVFVDDVLMLKIHVHTNHPGKIIEHAMKYGTLTMVKVENMRLQHSELLVGDGVAEEAHEMRTRITPATKKYGFAAVCMGEGITAAFRDLGVDSVIVGGQTMNPSTQDMLDAINRTPSEVVFVLPNNKNIRMVAEQAEKLSSEKKVVVIPSVSIPQGLAAMMRFNPELETEALKNEMVAAFDTITSMSVTHAVRNTTVEKHEIKKGQAIGLINGDIRFVGETSTQCLRTMLKKVKAAQFVTVLIGKDVESPEMTEKVTEMVKTAVPDAELTVLNGGQPLYDFIVSVE